jgi:hypothetical protein
MVGDGVNNRTTKLNVAAVGFFLLLTLVAPLVATAQEEMKEKPEALEGSIDVGYRTVDVVGNEDKYREDINLPDGALRLFGLDLRFEPDEAKWFDSLTLDARGVGGEPHTSARFGLRKESAYDLDLRYRSSDFFYRDAGYFFSDIGDLHRWDARREFLDFDLDVEVSDTVTLRFGADRMKRDGGSTSSRDVQHEVFLLDRPVDQNAADYWAGVDVRIGWADLTVEQHFTSNENTWELSTVGNEGVTAGGSFLDDYLQERSEDADAPISRILLTGRPDDQVVFFVGYARIDAEIDFETRGAWGGVDFDSIPFRTTLTNTGDVERGSDLWDAEVTFGVHEDVDLTFDFSHRSYDQEGTINSVEEQIGGTEAGLFVVRGDLRNELELDTIGIMADWRATPTLSFAAGAGRQERTKDFQLSGPAVETDRTIYRAGVRWRPNPIWNLRLDYEEGDDEGPVTPISVTSTDRLRVRANVRPMERLSLSLSYRDESKNNDESTPLGVPTDDIPPATDIFLAKFDTTTWAFDIIWNGGRYDISAGYSSTEVDSDAHIVYIIETVFTPVFNLITTRDRSAYTADLEVIHAELRYRFNTAWSAGVRGLLTDNSGTFPVENTVYGAEVRYEHAGGWYARAAFDTYDYREDNPYAGDPANLTPNVNDYSADLWTLALGYRF